MRVKDAPPMSTIAVETVLEVDTCFRFSNVCNSLAADHEQQSASRRSL